MLFKLKGVPRRAAVQSHISRDSLRTTGNGTHLDIVWVGFGRMGFSPDVDGWVEVGALVEVFVVVFVVFGGLRVVVVLLRMGKLFQLLDTITC